MYRSQAQVFSVSATTLLLLAAAVASGCGAAGGTGKPLAAFPTRADLTGIAQKAGPHPRIASDLIAPRDWQLEPIAPDARRPEHALLASATPHAKPSAALDCVAHELARLALDAPDKKQPDLGLRRFISGRCGAVAALYAFQSWGAEASLTDDDIVAQLRARLGKPLDVSATQAGVALARAGKRVSVVIVYGTPEVALDGLLTARRRRWRAGSARAGAARHRSVAGLDQSG